jgi:hypothetical protein
VSLSGHAFLEDNDGREPTYPEVISGDNVRRLGAQGADQAMADGRRSPAEYSQLHEDFTRALNALGVQAIQTANEDTEEYVDPESAQTEEVEEESVGPLVAEPKAPPKEAVIDPHRLALRQAIEEYKHERALLAVAEARGTDQADPKKDLPEAVDRLTEERQQRVTLEYICAAMDDPEKTKQRLHGAIALHDQVLVAALWAGLVARDRAGRGLFKTVDRGMRVAGMNRLKDPVHDVLFGEKEGLFARTSGYVREIVRGEPREHEISWFENALVALRGGPQNCDIAQLGILLDIVHPEPRYSFALRPHPYAGRVVEALEKPHDDALEVRYALQQFSAAIYPKAGRHTDKDTKETYYERPEVVSLYRIIAEQRLYRMVLGLNISSSVKDGAKYRFGTVREYPKTGRGANYTTVEPNPALPESVRQDLDQLAKEGFYGRRRGLRYVTGNW